MRCIDEQFLATPWYGSRQMTRHLRRQGYEVGPQAGASTDAADGADGPLPQATDLVAGWVPSDLSVSARCRGFHYLVAIMDWATRTVLSWRLSNYPGQCLLPGGPAGGTGPRRKTGHLQHRPVYLHDFQDGRQAHQMIAAWLRYYNEERPHSSLAEERTPMEEYARRRAA